MTPTPSLIIDWACDCICVADPFALSIVQSRLYFVHCAPSSFGSAETQRGEEAVSGSRMPTLLFFGLVDELADGLLLLLQPARAAAITVAAPTTAMTERVERIAACLLPDRVAASGDATRVVLDFENSHVSGVTKSHLHMSFV
jgi:hypothetical protein